MANSQDYPRIRGTLDSLRQGKPIGLDKFGLIEPVANEQIQEFCRNVSEATIANKKKQRFAIWLIATFGGGKTQALEELKGLLGERDHGKSKIFVPFIDLNNPATADHRSLQLALFEKASVLAPKSSHMEDASDLDELVSMGRDFLKDTLGEIPGVAPFLKWGPRAVKPWFYRWGPQLRRVVEKKYSLRSPRAVDLMVRWMRYALFPDNDAVRKAFSDYRDELAHNGHLFTVLADILEASGYASMVLLIDQAEKLVGKPVLTSTLQMIHDLKADEGAGESVRDLNLFFVLAGTRDVKALDDEGEYNGFVRRFRDPNQSSVIEIGLPPPKLQGQHNDIDRVAGVLQTLRQKHVGLPLPKIDNSRLKAIRAELVEQQGDAPSITWPAFWKVMLRE